MKELDLVVYFYDQNIEECISYVKTNLKDDGIMAIICEDSLSGNGFLISNAMRVEQRLHGDDVLKIKELVVVSNEDGEETTGDDILKITHKYILIYKLQGKS